MADRTVTLTLPEPLYDRYRPRARSARRSVEEELLVALMAGLAVDDALPADLERELAALAALDDEALWQAARSRLSDDEAVRLEALHLKRQREGLTEAETHAAADLTRAYEQRMLMRAQAAALLKQCGYDVASLLAPR